MRLLGLIILLIGLAGVIAGPTDPDYVSDWAMWFFCVGLAFVGAWMFA